MSNDFFLYILRYPIFLIRAFPRDGGWIFVSYIYSWLNVNNFYIISLPLYSKPALLGYIKGLIRERLRRKHSVDACPMIEWHRHVNRWIFFIYINTPYFVNTSFSTRRRMDIRLTHLLLAQ